jgi:hypothetical protein
VATTANITTQNVTTSNLTNLTVTNDASISGLTVGKGTGAAGFATAVGFQALNATNTGSVAGFGYQSLFANTSGEDNTAVGSYRALYSNTTGSNNIAVGRQALQANTTGSSNVSMGRDALFSNTTASFNTAIGYETLYSNTSGQYNTTIGYRAGKANTTGSVTAVGGFALALNTTGVQNVGVGGNDGNGLDAALYSNTTGIRNVAVGCGALAANTTADNNVAVGHKAGFANTTGSESIYIGGNAGVGNVTGKANTIIGYDAGISTTNGNNTLVGFGAGNAITTGERNTFIGTGVTGVVYGAGSAMTTGSKNTIIGAYTGNQSGLDIRTASNYIVLSDGDGNPRVVATGGSVFLGCTSEPNDTVNGFGTSQAYTIMSASQGTVLYVNRNTDDGVLVEFRQANSAEGNISVSGSTVSYNGGHLSRWSQLPDGSKDDTILKGTVLTNLDDMCVWEKDGVVADNEQLNKMKVSDVEGDTNVAGVFVNWTIDEQYGVDDMNVAMTGDMIIRIADGVVVQKGDLLMSAGDGTAKPQGDDIRRSKTVAKVTSNHVTCTYADGSYCVPCVLMAC